MEKAQQQQRKLQERQDAKELKEKQRKEKMQQQQQLKIEKQQMSRSNSHLSLVSQQSGSLSLGDGGSTPRSDNKSLPPIGDHKEVADMKPKIEQQETSLLMDHTLYKGGVSFRLFPMDSELSRSMCARYLVFRHLQHILMETSGSQLFIFGQNT